MGLTPPFSGTAPPIPTSYQGWWCPDSQPDTPIWGTQSLTLDGIDSQSLTGAGNSVVGQLVRRLWKWKTVVCSREWKGKCPYFWCWRTELQQPSRLREKWVLLWGPVNTHSPPPVSKRDGNWQPSNLFYLASSVVLKVHISCQKFKI